jgi:hypothetical protein
MQYLSTFFKSYLAIILERLICIDGRKSIKAVVRDPLMFSGGEWGHVALPFPVMQLWWTACLVTALV